jgi:hypothetical protein
MMGTGDLQPPAQSLVRWEFCTGLSADQPLLGAISPPGFPFFSCAPIGQGILDRSPHLVPS